MLTVKQPTTYGYRSVHDLPTPPSTSRPSPPLNYTEAVYNPQRAVARSHSPITQAAMSAPHRGLPPPAVMALPPQQQQQQQPPSSSTGLPPAQHLGHQQPQPPQQQPQSVPPQHAAAAQNHGPPSQGQAWSSLPPPPPQQWHGSEESMRKWLQARTEEEKTKQEEEKTRQEGLRLEQRKVEMDMLRASLGGGIPPPMIPLVFAGMAAGGTLPQTLLDWAQQTLMPSSGQPLQILPAQRQHSPDPQKKEGGPSGQGQFSVTGSNPTAPSGPPGYAPYPPSSPRPRGQTVSGVVNRAGVHPGNPQPGTSAVPPYGSQSHMHSQSASQDSSPLFFHHWQPPATQSGSGGSNRPGSPSGDSNKKRKVMGPQSSQTPSDQRARSPPSFVQSNLLHAAPGRKGLGHKRQKSDVSWYRPSSRHHMEESERVPRSMTPSREGHHGFTQDRYAVDPSKHSVSTLLSREPPGPSSQEASRLHYSPTHESDRPMRRHPEEEGIGRERTPPQREPERA